MSTRKELRALVLLSTPVVITQVGQMLLGVVDTMMVGWLGVTDLAAAALGHVWVMGTLIGAMGIVFGIDPLVSQAHGEGNDEKFTRGLRDGMVIAMLTSIPVAVLWLYTEEILVLLGQAPHLARMAREYVIVQIPGIPAFLLFTALRQGLQARGIVAPAMWIMLVANGINALLNQALIFGKMGFPALGLQGAGLATTGTRYFLLIALIGWILAFRLLPRPQGSPGWIHPRGLLTVLGYGLPVSIQLSLELWAFQVATLLAGKLGEVQLASHTIVLNMASLSFMVPLGIAIGAVTRVGNLIGARNPEGARRAAWVALGLGGAVMLGSATVFVVFRDRLPRFYTDSAPALGLAASILPVAAAFQIFDGVQVVGGGILRGMGRTLPAAVFNLVGYYLLALPLAYVLGLHTGLGLRGIWWGLVLGLFAVSLMLVLWIARRGPGTAVCPSRHSRP